MKLIQRRKISKSGAIPPMVSAAISSFLRLKKFPNKYGSSA
ncbi:MAG: hypothetical protein Q7U60_09170 [Candidatus Methanoperedens sp.]|nr:hypothetical protein [Candidatus Methanoperedens sp.]